MSVEDEEFQEFLEIFQEESLERLLNVARALEAIQVAPGADPAPHLDEVDRELHTIKGSARLLGFSELATLVHELEGLARAVRGAPALGYDLLVRANDRLSAMVEEASATGSDLSDEALLAEVRALLAGGAPGAGGAREPAPREHGALAPDEEPTARLALDQDTGPTGTARVSAEPEPLHPDEQTPWSRAGERDQTTLAALGPGDELETLRIAREVFQDEPTPAGTSLTPPVARPRPDDPRPDGAPDQTGAAPRRAAEPRRAEDEMLRVRASRLAELDEIVSDLTLARQRLDTYEARLRTLLNAVVDGAAGPEDVSLTLRGVVRDFRGDVLHVRNATGSLQHLAVDVRLRPVAHLFDRVPRLVRDLARQLGKRVRVRVSGEDTEMDRVILDALKSPLNHLLRNALDHGLETPAERQGAGKDPEGLLELSAGQEGNRVAIRVRDDGRGIDPRRVAAAAVERGILDAAQAAELSDEQAIQLVLAPGFSTKEGVTEISGRGVGMDAVRRTVEDLKGELRVDSLLGRGSVITIMLPLTLLISRVMLLRSGGQRFALPTEAIVESVRLPAHEVVEFNGRPTVRWREQVLPLVRLAPFLGQAALPDPSWLRALIVAHGQERLALAVEELHEERSVVVKPLGWPLERLPWVSGAVQDPSGEVALQLHVPELFNRRRRRAAAAEPQRAAGRTVLVVDDSIVSRQRLGRAMEALGFEVFVAVDGVDALGLLERVRPLLIVTDIEMPRLDGLGLARRIRAHRELSAVPLVVVSNRGSPKDRQAGLEAGADAYLPKSELSLTALRQIVERLL
ncbi:MAG: chemotaxis protein CheW [Planctomycetota bacterium]